jgi:spore coat protein CotH
MKKKILALIPFITALTACSFTSAPKKTTTTNGTEETTTSGIGETTTSTTIGETTTGTLETTTTNPTPTTTNPIVVEDHTVIPTYTSSDITLQAPDFSTRRIPNQDTVKYEDLFNLGNTVSISIDMEDSELEKLQSDLDYYTSTHCKSQLYRHCKSVTITLKNYENTFPWTIEDVGIRQKGNTSRKDEWPIIDESGSLASLNHFKLSFDETFDDAAYGADRIDWSSDAAGYALRKDREFLGLTGLDLKWNKNYDGTHIKEIYAHKLYKACGLISQNAGLSNFTINQVDKSESYDMGVYTIYEPAKKSLIKRNLQDNDIMNFGTWNEEKKGSFGASDSKYGDLYKCKWGIDLTYNNMNGDIGVGSMDGTYTPLYERKTNTSDTTYSDSLLKELGRAVATGNIDKIRTKLDMEYFCATEAVSYFVGNPDDLKNNTNNTMIYMRRRDGMGITIPIDNDRAFGITKDWNVHDGMIDVGPMDTNMAPSGNSVINLYKNTILKSGSASNKLYLAWITALYNSDWLKDSTFEELFNIAKNTYEGTVSSDFDYIGFSLTDSNVSFSNYITAKKNLCKNYLDTNPEDGGDETDGDYGNLYIAGSLNGWSGKDYPFTYLGDGVYTITFTPKNVSGNKIEFKINNGEGWDVIDWTIDLSNNELVMEKSGNCVLTGVTTSSVITITFSTITKQVDIQIL